MSKQQITYLGGFFSKINIQSFSVFAGAWEISLVSGDLVRSLKLANAVLDVPIFLIVFPIVSARTGGQGNFKGNIAASFRFRDLVCRGALSNELLIRIVGPGAGIIRLPEGFSLQPNRIGDRIPDEGGFIIIVAWSRTQKGVSANLREAALG
jgi:hypothetical protein